MAKAFYVYILANWKRSTYVGITRDLQFRLQQHATGAGSRFVFKYRLRRLVYVEVAARAADAIAREKQIKGWVRRRKVALIGSSNPDWRDLSAEWGWRASLDSSKPHRV